MKSLATLASLVLISSATAQSITIHAGDHDRSATIVSFAAPKELTAQWFMRSTDGAESDLQIDESGHAIFVEPHLSKGQARTYELQRIRLGARSKDGPSVGVDVKRNGSSLQFTSQRNQAPIFTYQMVPGPVPEGTSSGFAHGAHLHPVYSPGGLLVTGNHPPDHPHQRGIWFAWTHTEFEGREADFWNMGNEKHGGVTGEVRFDKLVKSWTGPVHGGFVSTHRWIDHTGGAEKDMLKENWEVTVFHTIGMNDARGNPLPPVFLIDLVSTQNCAGSEPVKLPKYHYGGLGVRGNALWDPPANVTMLTSNGDNRLKGDGTKAKWVWLGGEVDGKPTGITVLIHPSNFRFPQPLRLNPKNPQLCVAPSADGDWSIEPGKPYVSRYRIVISDGRPDAKEIGRLWNDYAEPPKVDVK